MKIRGLLIAVLVFAALAGVLYWSDHRKSNAEAAKPDSEAPPAILKVDENSITNLELKKKDAPAIHLTKSGSDWKITEPGPFAADQSAVSSMISTVSSLNAERMVDDKNSDLQRYGLDHPSFEFDVAEKDHKTQRLLLGDDTPAGSAVYAALAGDPRVFTIASYSKSGIDRSLNDLRDKRLLTMSPEKLSRLEISRTSGNIEFVRNKEEWQFVQPKPMRADSESISDLVHKLTDARMDLSASEATAKESDAAFAHGTPVATIKVTDESSTERMQIRKNKDSYYGKSNVLEGAHKLDSSLGDAVSKKVDDFRNKKLFDFGYGDPSKLEIRRGQNTYSLLRGGQNWWDNGKKIDESSVATVISDLRSMSADKFVDSGFTAPETEVIVTSDDGKRVEKVQIAKSGSNYVAKRDGDSTLYQLSTTAVADLQKSFDGIKPVIPSK